MAEQEGGQGGGIPYIGSLISLVSASGQRYRGTLYTVDLNESTIALQNGASPLCSLTSRWRGGQTLRRFCRASGA